MRTIRGRTDDETQGKITQNTLNHVKKKQWEEENDNIRETETIKNKTGSNNTTDHFRIK